MEKSMAPTIASLGSMNSALKVGSVEWHKAMASMRELTALRRQAAEAEVQKAAADYAAEKATKKEKDAKDKAKAGEGGGGMAQAAEIAAAAAATVQAMQQAFDTIKGFVEALSPATVQMFSMEMRNLQATIGQAFLPVIQIATQVVRDFADRLSPVMQQFAPVLGELVSRIAGALMPVLGSLVQIIQALLPALQIVTAFMPLVGVAIQLMMETLMMALSPVIFGLQVLAAAMQSFNILLELAKIPLDTLALLLDTTQRVMDAFSKTIVQLLHAFLPMLGLGDAVKGVRDMFRDLAGALVKLVAVVAKMFGADKFLENLAEAFKPEEGHRAMAAGPAAIKGLEQIAKDIATASAMAQGKGTETEADRARKEEAAWRKTVADSVKDIAVNGKTAEQQWKEFEKWLFKLMSEEVPKKIGYFVVEAIDNAKRSGIDWVNEQTKPVGGGKGIIERGLEVINPQAKEVKQQGG